MSKKQPRGRVADRRRARAFKAMCDVALRIAKLKAAAELNGGAHV